jgi:SAM-dependent methyltransferase
MPDPLFFRNEVFTVVECQECGLGFVNPRPTISEIQKYYPAKYYQGPPTGSHERYLRRRFTAEASYLKALKNGAGRKRLLDVGCANGEFPRFMAMRGWEVEGVEVAESSEGIHDFRVYTEEFDKIPVHEPRYDAVTAWAVLEHVHDPMAYFRKAAQVVKKGGLFVFLVTNFKSAASRHLFCEDVPRHLYFFTRETVRRYLEKTGFGLEREDNGRNIHKMAPYNWTGYMVRSRLLGKKYEFRDMPLTSKDFRRTRNLKPGLLTALKYAAYSPMIETAQVLRKTYGISTYVAHRLG